MERNYQFFDHDVYTNSVVVCCVNTDIGGNVETGTYGFKPTNIKIKITDTALHGCIIKSIDNEPASKKFLEKVQWPIEFFDENLYRRTLFYPICFKINGKAHPRVIGTVLGDYLGFVNKALSEDGEIYIASGRGLMNSVDDVIKKFEKDKIKLGFIISCTARLETLGKSVYKTYDILKEYYGSNPFITVYLSGEDARKPGEDSIRLNESFNMFNILK